MRIGIDARWIFSEMSGVGIYTAELVRHLVTHDAANEYVLFFSDPLLRERTMAEYGLTGRANVSTRLLPYGLFSIAGQLYGPVRLADAALDVYHSTNYMIPLRAFPRAVRGRPACVVTIHDLIPLLFPDHAPRSKKSRLFPLYRFLMREIARRADLILTVSDVSRRDIIRLLRIPPGREEAVVAIPNGVSPAFVPPEDRVFGALRERVILYVGRADPYKNLVGLIEAFARVRAAYEGDVRLRIVGSRDPRYPEAEIRARELGLLDAVSWAGHVTGAELARIYGQADVLAAPSRYEGFGLPVLEAMACGTPVVCSRSGSLPEVVGDAALTAEWDDTDGLGSQILELLRNEQLARRFSEQGIRRAGLFSWERTARETLAAYSRFQDSDTLRPRI